MTENDQTAHADKRSISTDALETLGTIIGEYCKRDAIHLAVYPTKANEKLFPGQDVGIEGSTKNPLGIVDPFLKAPVFPGQWFWLVIYPRQITSLRHVWTHPAIPGIETAQPTTEAREYSERWLRGFADSNDCPRYETLVAAASGEPLPATSPIRYTIDTNYLHFDGSDAHGEIPPEFWDHVENVTGKKLTVRPGFFSCSC